MFNIKRNLAKKLDLTLKQPFEGITISYSILRTKLQVSTPLLRDKTLKFCTRVLHAHPEA